MKVEFLSATRVRLTRGWFRKKTATARKVEGDWFYETNDVWVGGAMTRTIEDEFSLSRFYEELKKREAAWEPVVKLPKATLIK